MDLAFNGLLLATVVLTPRSPPSPPCSACLLAVPVAGALVALPRLVASYGGEAAFKETLQALWVLAFALQLRAGGRGTSLSREAHEAGARRRRQRLHLQLPEAWPGWWGPW